MNRHVAIHTVVWACLLFSFSMPWCRVMAGEAVPEAFSQDRHLVAIVNVRNLDSARAALKTLFTDIYPDTSMTDPIGQATAEYLVNPELRDLAPRTYLEILVFNPNATKGGTTAMAFLVNDPARYRRTLAGQHGVRQEHVLDDITRYRLDQQAGRAVVFYLTITPGNVVIFGYSREAVRRSRDLYLASGAAGLMPGNTSTVRAELAADRFGNIHDESLAYALESLRVDLQQDLAPGTPPEHPLGLGLAEAMRTVHDAALQLEHVALQIDIDSANLSLKAQFRPKAESLMAAAIRAADGGGGGVDLAEVLPADAPYREWTSVWPTLTTHAFAVIDRISDAAVGGLLDRDTRTRALSIADTVKRAAPKDMASVLMIPPLEEGELQPHPPVRLQVIRWGAPALVPVLLDRIGDFIRSSSMQELLAQNGLDIRWSQQPVITHVGQTPVSQLKLRVRMRNEGQFGASRASVWDEYVFAYLHVMVDDVWLVATSLSLRDPKKTETESQDMTLRLMEQSIRSIQDFQRAPEEPTNQNLLTFITVRPVELARTALIAEAWRVRAAGLDARARSLAVYAEEFVPYAAAEDPVVIRFERAGAGLNIETRLPTRTIRLSARACLGLGVGSEEEGQR